MSTVLITGANRGVGLALVEAYRADGWDVIATTRAPDPEDELHTLAARDDHVAILPLDLEQFDQIEALGKALAAKPIDVLFANGALTGGAIDTFGEVDYANWERMFRVNCMAQMRLAEVLADNVSASTHKKMMFVSSRVGARAMGGYVGYMSAKHALNYVTYSLSTALAQQGVTVAACHPGHVATRAARYRGALTPEECAACLKKVVDEMTMEDTGSFFDPDGSKLQLVTRQMNPDAFGAMSQKDSATLHAEFDEENKS